MTQPPPIQASRVRCVSCGYNLTGVTIGGECPECGALIETSLQAAQAAKTNGAALWSMILGILALTVCGLLGPVAIILNVKARRELEIGVYSSSSRGLAKAGLILGIVGTVLTILGALLFAFGMWANF